MSWWDIFPNGWFGTGSTAKLSEATDPARVHVIRRGNAAGKPVTPNTALQLSTAWSCVRLIAEIIGTLPMGVFTKDAAGNKTAAQDHDLYSLIHDDPNADQSACEFWESMAAGLCLWGNGYAEKANLLKRTTALNPLPCGHGGVTVFRDPDTNARRYRFPDRGKMEELPEEKMFHVRGFGVGGDQGLSPIGFARESMGAALAAEEVAAGMFGSGLHLSGFIEQENKAGAKLLTPDQVDQIVKLFAEFAGSANAGRVMPLQPGMKFAALGMNPEDAQLLQTRAFNVEEICRWFRVPPWMVGHTEKSTSWGTGLEQQMIAFLTFSLNPYLKRIEQAVKKQLLPVTERGRVFAEFNRDALLQADSAGRAALYASAGQNGWMDRNEIRAKENLPPRPGAGALTVQSNLVPLDQLGMDGGEAQQVRAALMTLLFGGDIGAVIDDRIKLLAGPPAQLEA